MSISGLGVLGRTQRQTPSCALVTGSSPSSVSEQRDRDFADVDSDGCRSLHICTVEVRPER